MGPKTAAADSLHAMKYRSDREDFREAINRLAFGLKDNDEHYHVLRDIFGHQRFCPGGRIQGAVGSLRETTPYNCYVSGTIADSAVHGDGAIFQRVTEAFATMRMGGGIGYDFSTLRPKGALIRKLMSSSSGPISFMRVFNEAGLCAASSGHRRGAQMGVLRIDHPDVLDFVRAKQNATELTGFNISVAVTDEFMEALAAKQTFNLRFNNEVYSTVDAEELWETIMRSTWDWSEPGVLFIDRVNEWNNLKYCETITATNPCGEQPLPPFGACLLGSFNLVQYLKRKTGGGSNLPVVTIHGWEFDFEQFKADIPPVVRAMDNVIDRARYPLPSQKVEAISKRRMGLGIMGLANAGEACGFEYGSKPFLDFEEKVLTTLRDESYRASVQLARDKGPFPYYSDEHYPESKFVQSLPDDIQLSITQHGIRNSHLTSIAPTGTISMCADNVSSGLEPVFAYQTKRPINTPTGQMIHDVEDYGVAFLGVRGKLAQDVTADQHIAVLTTAQRCVDSAVSKTCNVSGKMPWDDFRALYLTAYNDGAKGCTTFNADGQRGSLLSASESNPGAASLVEGEVCRLDPETGRRDCG